MIRLNNPSFEDTPRAGELRSDKGIPPKGWFDCGASDQSVPDVQPSHSKDPGDLFFGVSTAPFDGKTYLGMVVRKNDTHEALGQRLRFPIKAGTCYDFRLHLARSEIYLSPYENGYLERYKANPRISTNHDQPIKIRIWGGNGYCYSQELLGESPLIKHTDWREYVFRFEPKNTHRFIMIEAYYNTPTLFPYDGNILVDNGSNITVVPCDEAILYKPVVDITKPVQSPYTVSRNYYNVIAKVEHVVGKKDIRLVVNGKASTKYRYDKKSKQLKSRILLNKGKNRIEITAVNKAGQASDKTILDYEAPGEALADATIPDSYDNTVSPPVQPSQNTSPKPFEPKIIDEFKVGRTLKEGQVIRLNKLYFEVDSATIKNASYPILEEVYTFMMSNPSVMVEVGGHTNNRCDTWFCDQLSEARAKAVAYYLQRKGIQASRLTYKGYGKRKPVATNNTSTGRKNNQRVEIKILSLSG